MDSQIPKPLRKSREVHMVASEQARERRFLSENQGPYNIWEMIRYTEFEFHSKHKKPSNGLSGRMTNCRLNFKRLLLFSGNKIISTQTLKPHNQRIRPEKSIVKRETNMVKSN